MKMKINLLMKKEEIDTEKIDKTKIAVVLDILMATTSITAALAEGAKSVIPVLNEAEAISEKKKYNDKEVCIAGEAGGFVIDGFLTPVPLSLCKYVQVKKVILSTTNVYITIRSNLNTKKTYIASLLNSVAVAKDITSHYNNESILIICAGSSGQFCLEDFYGAGYLINELIKRTEDQKIELSDSAK